MTLDLYLIRHAESRLNEDGHLIGGRTNHAPLTTRGKEQAILLGQRLADGTVNFNEVYASPAVRTVQTAQIVCGTLDFPLDAIVQRKELQELSQGDWEGKSRDQIYTDAVLKEINRLPGLFRPPNGESQDDVEKRMYAFVQELIAKGTDITAGIFGHGMAFKCLLRGIMEFNHERTYKIALDNTSITRVKYTPRGWHLLSVNDTGHLIGTEKLPDRYSTNL